MSDMGRRDFITLLGGAASHSKQTNDRAMSTLQPPSLQFLYDHHLPNRRSHLRRHAIQLKARYCCERGAYLSITDRASLGVGD
jgi:hypothetical protein